MHKLEKLILESYAELLTEMDGGRLFDYLSTKYHVKDHFHSDDSFMVTRRSDTNDQYVIFDYDKDKNQFYIRQLGGYSIDDAEAGEAGMNGKGGSRIAGIESYYTDGNYSPEEISAEALKKIVDHVMGGLDREAEAQRAFYAKRGRTSGTIDEMSLRQIEKESGGRPTQWEDLTDAQRAGIVKRYGEPNFDGVHDFFGSDMDTYFKATKKNDETGSITHKVIKLPSFASIYHNFSDIIADIKKLMGSDDVRKDERARELFDIVKTNFRKLQRYLRIERPEQYRMLKMQRMMEGIKSAFTKIEERMDMNDPVAIKVRAAKMKRQQAKKQTPKSRGISLEKAMDLRLKLQDLEDERADVLRNMEQEAEPEGGPIADDYGAILNDIDKKIDRIMSALRRYDMNEEEDGEETDYVKRRREEDDYYEDPDYYKENVNESLIDEVDDEPQPEEPGDEEAPKDTVLEDATDQILSKFPTLKAAIVKLQTEDFKEFVDSIDWISPRPTEFRINLKNGQDYIMKWTGTGFEAQIMGKRYYIDKINDYQQALDKLAILYKEGPMSGAGEGEPADVDSGGSAGGGGGDFPGDDAAGGGGADIDDLGGDDAGADDAGGGEDLGGEPIDFEEPAEEPEA